jgi:ParB-like nuclease family protein
MTHTEEIRPIPIKDITILNPRARNRRVFNELVTSIAHLGLKKPITVSERPDHSGYNLVCGQGRLEAFIALGQTEIPAIVLEDRHFAALPPDDYLSFIVAVEIIRTFLGRWAQVDMAERNLAQPPRICRTHLLSQKHPMEVVHDALRACPDEVPHGSAGAFSFLQISDLADSLRLDSSVAISALGSGEFKPAAVMAGSVIEALLLWAEEKVPGRTGSGARGLGCRFQEARVTPRTAHATWVTSGRLGKVEPGHHD